MRATLRSLVFVALLVLAPAAHACGEGGFEKPQGVSDAPLVIGDSVTVAASGGLLQMGAAVDARVCRRFDQGLQIMRAHKLPSVVVVALGSNPAVSEGQVQQAISLAGDRLLAFVIPRELRTAHAEAARAVRAAVQGHPEITLLDWARDSAGHPGWFAPDGIHPRGLGVSAYVQLIGSFLAASKLSGEDGFDTKPQSSTTEPKTLSDDEVYPQLVGSILRGALASIESAPRTILGDAGAAAPKSAAEQESDPIAPVRRGRGHLPPWAT
jgi:hypothetical protein